MANLSRLILILVLLSVKLDASNVAAQIPPTGILNVVWSPDGQRIAIAGTNGLLRIETINSGSTITLNGHTGLVTGLAWSHDSQRLASSGQDGVIRIWSISGTQLGQFFGSNNLTQDLDWNHDGTRLASASMEETNGVKIWNTTTYSPSPEKSLSITYVSNIEWNATGTQIAFGTPTGAFLVPGSVSTPIGNPSTYALGLREQAYSLTWNPSGTQIAIGYLNKVAVWNATTLQQIWLITGHMGVVEGIAWSPNGDRIASISSQDDAVKIWNADTGALLATYPNNSSVASLGLAWNPNPNLSHLVYGGTASTALSSVQPPVLAPLPNMITNGTFTGALAPWTTAAAPNPADLVWRIQDGVLEFYRTTTSTFGAISQTTGTALPALTPLEARLSIGNSSGVRRRLTVTLEDASDGTRLQNCVFWLPANAPLRTFIVRTYAPQAWGNLRLTLSEGTATGSGWLRVDNVEVRQLPGGGVASTTCADPNIPAAANVTDSVNLFNNGDFSNGLTGWYFGGDITYRLTLGVLEFYKTIGGTANATVVNSTAQINPAARLELTLDLGNSSASAKRITVILNDGDWTDSQTCNFWLPAGAALGRYTMRTFNDTLWNPVHVSVFESVSGQAWTQLDNIDLRRRAALSTVGVECYQPGAALP